MGRYFRFQGGVMMFKKIVLFLSLFCLVGIQTARPQAMFAPAENFVVNRAVAGIFERVAIARGLASSASDATMLASLNAMSSATTALNVAATGVAAVVGFLGAPVWLTIAASVGVLAAGTALVLTLAPSSSPPGSTPPPGGSTVTVSRSADGKTISVSQPPPASVMDSYVPGPPPAMPDPSVKQSPMNYGVTMLGMAIYSTSTCMSGDPCSAYPPLPSGQKNFTRNGGTEAFVLKSLADVNAYDAYEQAYNSCSTVGCTGSYDTSGIGYDSLSVSVYFKPSADDLSTTLYEDRTTKIHDANGNPQIQTTSQPASWWLPGPGLAPIIGTDLSQIYPQLSPAAKQAPLDPGTLAGLTNQVWQRAAAAPNYQGIPFSAAMPIATPDAQAWITANPGAVPTFDDVFRPASNAGSSTVPLSPTVTPASTIPVGTDPGTIPASGTPGTGSTGALCGVNGVVCTMNVVVTGDPGTPAPTLESTPTIDMILSPIVNLFPDLRSWVVPAHSGTCPRPSFEAFGHSFTMDQHCDLFEQFRPTISTICTAVFALSALFIVLAA
jgi:hypothetical protein